MRVRLVLAVLLLPGIASADPVPVIGGTPAPTGKWPDVVALPFDGSAASVYCTGTLIAKNVVITAGHCVIPEAPNDPPPPNVLIGASSLAHPEQGDLVDILAIHEYPDSQHSVDVAVLVLAADSTKAPHPIATGWARADIANGAAVAFVGFGATDRDASTYPTELQEASSSITDFDCTVNKTNGCNAAAMPAGELGAGGMGIDTCPGDSGGPMYLVTDYGTFLAGVTSRGYDRSQYLCSEGGIYERPDKVVDWIEMVSGAKILRGPEPTADPIVATSDGGMTEVTPNDPKGGSHTFAIAVQPVTGVAGVRDDGQVLVCPSAAGDTSVVVTVTDAAHETRSVDLTIAIHADAAATHCSVDDFLDTGGCCDSGRNAGGSIPLALGLAAFLRRRRR